MPNFNGIVITNSGKVLLAKAQQGKTLSFSKMQLGSANDITNPTEKTAVTSPFLTTKIRNVNLTTDGSARISTFISNENLTQSYVWREIGLFAVDPDTQQEVLYAYKCAGENGETIPAGGGADVIEKIFDIVIKVNNASSITAVIDESTVLLSREEIVQELDDCEDEENKVPSAKLFYEKIMEKLDITGGTIDGKLNVLRGITANITGDVTGNCSGSSGSCTGNANSANSCSGNAGSATKLQNSRNINGTSFNGTGDITTSKWGTARKIDLNGAISGSVNMDGSKDVTINTTLNNFKLLEGTVYIDTSESRKTIEINYPDGFTQNNCVVLSFGVKIDTLDMFYELLPSAEFKKEIYLGRKINLGLLNMNERSVRYKIVLMKIS